MFAISVDLLHGTFRGDGSGASSTGLLTRGEWPPSPARLFGALVAADGTGPRCRVTDGSELKWFERLPPPVIHADHEPHHQVLLPRFVVEHSGKPARNTHQEYLGRKGVEVRSGVRVAPRVPRITYVWEMQTPGAPILDALRLRVARIGYLGTSDSPARVRVLRRPPDVDGRSAAFTPDQSGDLAIAVPAEGDLLILDAMYEAWCDRGASVARSHFPALRHEASYRSLRAGVSTQRDRGGVVAWLRLGAPVSGRRVSVVTACFKAALLSKYQSHFGEPPPVLHGHGFSERGYDIARFLALPDAGFPRSRGRIFGLALWLPPGAESVERRRCRDAAHAVRRLTGSGVDVRVAPHDGAERPLAANPSRWTRSSRRWVTAFPAIHERRGPVTLAELSRWCRHAGLPAPLAFRSTRGPLVCGGVDLAPVEVNRPGRPRLPYSHVELWFKEPIRGPVVVGAGRQRGFGLCVPARGGGDGKNGRQS
ncbi:MAG: type I-U CRISPR-associated protein Cas5/Cas6 [Holophagales bacterium]|nr:type I-U CRISPR-associated protein Cas5/Cas6 [Holophagales bacterium]MYG31619.1 type I-U CRISPR-associated protein Cas5/Cas6 [Holophagales bacterium]MYI78312.1 type I-U CRISPR-associated protein Cas5/Cas6 [Holophagales bacterium]